MRKRIVIGDPHGRWECVKQAYDNENPDDVIILGDYFDSFNIDEFAQRDCYDNIINLRNEHIKKKKGNKFIMLIGNHDMHYMDENFGRCSGWNPSTCSLAMFRLCRDWDKEILKMCYIDEINSTIYSHAGVSQNWFDTWCQKSLGNINTVEVRAFAFTYREGGDSYGSSTYSSPLWLRPEGLKKSPLVEFIDENGEVYCWNQVFGHTQPDAPMKWEQNHGVFYGIDCIYKHYLVEEIDDDGIITNRYLGNIKQ